MQDEDRYTVKDGDAAALELRGPWADDGEATHRGWVGPYRPWLGGWGIYDGMGGGMRGRNKFELDSERVVLAVAFAGAVVLALAFAVAFAFSISFAVAAALPLCSPLRLP